MSNFKCAECGSELKATRMSAECDYSDDIKIYVELFPCDSCIKASFNEGKEEAESESE